MITSSINYIIIINTIIIIIIILIIIIVIESVCNFMIIINIMRCYVGDFKELITISLDFILTVYIFIYAEKRRHKSTIQENLEKIYEL
jgi:hypothetical protein